jgi:arylsulfatase
MTKKKNKTKKLKNNLIKLKDNLFNFIKYNRLFLSYVILSFISCFLLRALTIGNPWDIKANVFDITVIMLFGSLAYFIKPKKQYILFISLLCFYTILNIVNSVYYAFFNSFASFSLLASMGQTAEVTDAVFEKLKVINFVYLIMPIIFIFINKYLKKKKYFDVVEKIEVGKKLFTGVAIVAGIFLFINISTLSGKDLSRFSKQWNREYVVSRFGIIVYQGNDLVQTIKSKVSSMFGYEEAAKNFSDYYKENTRPVSKNKYTNKYKDYNVIVIHMESIMNFLIGLKINNEYVTPNLNKLVNESMYFDNFYPQVSVGTSSDTEFTFNTSLMPVQSGTVFVSYYNRNYVTLEKLLSEKSYYTFSMHGNKASMWNRSKMHMSLGYKDFYSEEYYNVDEVVGLGLSDKSFFTQSESLIRQINDMVKDSDEYKNYMGTIITLSNHTPFDDESLKNTFDVTYHTGKLDENGKEIVYDYLENTTMGNYIKSAHYADKCLGEFIDYVKKHDEYNKTLFVLYGDHAAQLSKKQFENFVNYDFATGEQKLNTDPTYINYDYYENELFKKTPLIFYTKDNSLKEKVSYPIGMIDVLPTIGNMLGIYNKYALGHDIFEIKNKNTVVFPNGNFLTNKVYYYNSKNEMKVFNSETLDANYINEHKQYTEKILEISNDIIVYDLIEKEGKDTNEKK